MADELIISQTKIVVPQRRKELLSRTRLLDLLSDLLDYRLIIIAAPAGYGKTSILIDFSAQYEWPFCWFALDPLDNDLHRFLMHFISCIRMKFPGFGDELLNILSRTQADQIDKEYFISVISNEIFEKITEHFVIVLDDFHLLHSSEHINQFLSDFIQRVDDNCHLVITSRQLLTLPDLPLMVARSQVGGLSIEELAFTPDEIYRLYNEIFHRSINKEEASRLASQTDGWITGLLLTSQILRTGLGEPEKISRTSGIGLYEYLSQQVFDQQSQDMQEFLLNSSILEEFDADMCKQIIGNALSRDEDYAYLMDQLVHDNLFVLPVDDEYKWLRYHHLFRDFLQSKLQNSRPDDAVKIKLELAAFYVNQKDWEKAVDIYQKLNEPDAIIDLIKRVGSDFLAMGKISRLHEWLSWIPEDQIKNHYELQAIMGAVEVNQGRVQDGKYKLDAVIHFLQGAQQKKPLAENLIRRSAVLRMLGQYEEAQADAEQAIELLHDDNHLEKMLSEALRAKGAVLYQTGNAQEGLDYLNQALRIYERLQADEDAARIRVEIGAINETCGQYTVAEINYQHALAYWQSVGDSTWISTVLNNLGVLQHSMGNYVASFNNLEKSISYSKMTGNKRMQGYALASIGDLYRDMEAGDEAALAYQESLTIAQHIEDQYLIIYLLTAISRLEINQKSYGKANTHLKTVSRIITHGASEYEQNKYFLEQGALQFHMGEISQSIDYLEKASRFFTKADFIDDAVRTNIYLLIAYYQNKNINKAKSKLEKIITDFSDPSHQILCKAIWFSLRDSLTPLQNTKEIGGDVVELLSKTNDFQQLIQKSRRRIRKEASVVPFAPPKIEIHAFGKTEIFVKNRLLSISDWKTTTSRDLFLLFLAHPEGLTKEEIGELMWPDSSPTELKLRFKNAIYRMRHAIGSEVVVFRDNYYQFNRLVDYEYDVQNFISLTNLAREEKNTRSKIEYLKSAIETYKGIYLPDIDEYWVMPDRQKFHEMHMQNLLDLAGIYRKENEFLKSLDYCQLALAEDSCHEEAYRISMQVHADMGNRAAVTRQFELCRKILQQDIGAEPSPKTINLYQNLLEQS